MRSLPALLALATVFAVACGTDAAATFIPTPLPTPLASPAVPTIEKPTPSPDATATPAPTPTPVLIGGWVVAAPMLEPRANHAAVRLADGRVLVIGGNSDIGETGAAEIYDPESDSWTQAAPMTEVRESPRAVLLDDGRVLVSGGEGENNLDLASAEIYDPATDSWSALPPMSSQRSGHTMTIIGDGRVVVTGGFDGGDFPDFMTDAVEIFDPATNTWQPAEPMPADSLQRDGARGVHGAVQFGEAGILVVGGLGFGSGGLPDLASVLIFDAPTGEWRQAGALFNGRRGHTTTALGDGRVLVAGGQGPQPLAEIYDPEQDAWLGAGANIQPRQNHAALLLADGTVMVVGGSGGPGVGQFASAEIFDPASGEWALAAPMQVRRSGHTVTLLEDGRVLVVGGGTFGDGGTIHASAEIFNPDAS